MTQLPALDEARPHLRLVPRDNHMTRMEQIVAAVDAAMSVADAPTRERPCQEMRPRGVYVSDMWDSNGNPILYAVDSRSRVRRWISWHDGQPLEEIQRDLWHVLNQFDPI